MATTNNPGTPDGGQPQPDATNANQPKLYAGKYKTLEEAVELGYGGLEKGFNELNERVSNVVRLLEVAVAPPQDPVPTTGAAGYGAPYDPYGRGNPPANPQQAVVDFITNPHAHLQAREDALLQKVGNIVSNTVTNAMAVADFKLRNPDLVKHEPLVRTFMGQTDPRKSVAERLEEAAKAARSYISQNFQAPANAAPAGNNYVEPPRGPTGGFVPGSPAPVAGDTSADEQALVDFLNDRNVSKAQNMGVGYDPNDKK